MNKYISIAVTFFLGATIAIAETPDSKPLEQQSKELSRAPVDYAVAGKWFKLAKEIPDDGQRQEALMASAAALIYAGKGDVYQKSVRAQIDNAPAFENEFLTECPDCHGGGESGRPCPVCKGTGRCQYANCQGGMHRIHQINGDRYEPCRECKGSGQCQKCNGRGDLEGKCVRCGGKGKSMDRELALAAYKKHADTATRWEQVERERKERERKEAEEKERKEREKRQREEEAQEMKERGLVNIAGKWMTLGSRPNLTFTVLQKLLVEGVTMVREPYEFNERGGILTLDIAGNIDCILVTSDEYHDFNEKQTYKRDLYRCGWYSYTTVDGKENTVRLYATDCETALEELESRKYSQELR